MTKSKNYTLNSVLNKLVELKYLIIILNVLYLECTQIKLKRFVRVSRAL